jgi:hypothetical protein
MTNNKIEKKKEKNHDKQQKREEQLNSLIEKISSVTNISGNV